MRRAEFKYLINQRIQYVSRNVIGMSNNEATRRLLTSLIKSDPIIRRYNYQFTINENDAIPGRLEIRRVK